MLNHIEKSILSTIVYYDVLSMPLTGFEVWKYLINTFRARGHSESRQGGTKNLEILHPVPGGVQNNVSLEDIILALESGEMRNYIDQKNGFYFLRGHNNLYEQRIEKKKIADQKWKKVRKIVKWFQAIPYVRMVAVSGSLAQNNTKLESDLDLLIVIKNGRIWIARALITFLAVLLGVRRHGSKTRDRICLNHYITDESLEIKFRSLYNAQTYAHLACLTTNLTQIENKLNTDTQKFIRVNQRTYPRLSASMYADFQKANSWIKDYLFFPPAIKNQNQRFIKPNLFLKSFAKFGEFLLNGKIGGLIEKFLKNIQLAHIEKHPLRHKKGGRIMADDFQLEFHPDSPEKEILKEYNKKMIQLGFPELGREKDSGLS